MQSVSRRNQHQAHAISLGKLKTNLWEFKISPRDIEPSSHIKSSAHNQPWKIHGNTATYNQPWRSGRSHLHLRCYNAVIWLRMKLNGQVIVLCRLRMVVFHRGNLGLRPVSYRKKGHSGALGASGHSGALGTCNSQERLPAARITAIFKRARRCPRHHRSINECHKIDSGQSQSLMDPTMSSGTMISPPRDT